MLRQLLLTTIALMLSGAVSAGHALEPVWSIGKPDQQAGEFALATGDHADFLNRDFGWENRFYLIGHSSPENDWPYVLPGPADRWAGSGGMAGVRTQILNVLFQIDAYPAEDTWRLVIDLLGHSSRRPPVLKVSVNGLPHTFRLDNPVGEELLEGDWSKGRIPIPLIEMDHLTLTPAAVAAKKQIPISEIKP